MSRRRPESRGSSSGEDSDPESVVRSILLRRLAAAARTRRELEKDLAKRGADPSVAARVLDRFEEVGLIDDVAFAKLWVESRHRGKALSRSALQRELRERGVDRDVIDEALSVIDDDDEWVRARQFGAAKARLRPGEDPRKAARRLAGQLARKGYPPHMCFAVAAEALAGVAEKRQHDVIDESDAGLIVDDFPAQQESV